MIKFYQPITTISSMIGTVTGSILNIFEKNFPEKFFNHIYIDTRLAAIQQRNKKKKILGFKLPALAIKPNFLLEETLIDSSDIMPFTEVILNDPENGIYIEAIMERVKFSMEIKLKIESKLKAWDVVGWLKRNFIYKAPALIPNIYLDTIFPSNLVKDLLKVKNMEQTMSDVDTLIAYLNINTKSIFEFFRKFNISVGKNTVLFRHPENILYTINDYPQLDFSKKGFSETDNYIGMELNVETWFPVGFKTNFQNSLDNTELPVTPDIVIEEGIIDYPSIYDNLPIIPLPNDNNTIPPNDPFYPPDDPYIPSDDTFITDDEDFGNLEYLFNLILDDVIKEKIKLYLKNYNASKDKYYDFDVILNNTSIYEKNEEAYENFIKFNNFAKLGLNKIEYLLDNVHIDYINSIQFRRSKYNPNQEYGNLSEITLYPINRILDIETFNSPSDNDKIFPIVWCHLTQNDLDIINNDIISDPTDEEIIDNENEDEFILNPNNTLLDYYLSDDPNQLTLTFYGPMTHSDYDTEGRRKIFSTYFVSDVNYIEDTLELYNEFSDYYKTIIGFMLKNEINLDKVFKIYLYSRNGSIIQPEHYKFSWETLKLILKKPYYNMTFNLVIYANMIQLKYYADLANS